MTGAAVFGKLPAHGDFIARGLPQDSRGALDRWLSGSIADARDALGDGFDDAFDAAPPWRFARSGPGGWVAGAAAPSVDAAGRRFPVLAQRAVSELARCGDAAAHCEAAIYAAFDGGCDADGLLADVARPIEAWRDEWPGRSGWWTMGSETRAPAALAEEWPAGLIRAMLTLPARIGEDAGIGEAE